MVILMLCTELWMAKRGWGIGRLGLSCKCLFLLDQNQICIGHHVSVQKREKMTLACVFTMNDFERFRHVACPGFVVLFRL